MFSAGDRFDDSPEAGEGFDAITATARMLDLSEGILAITGACANVRNAMRDEQGWGTEFSEEFSQELVRALVTEAINPPRTLDGMPFGGVA